eukprot:970620-Prorocentrum_lima.AAC.1
MASKGKGKQPQYPPPPYLQPAAKAMRRPLSSAPMPRGKRTELGGFNNEEELLAAYRNMQINQSNQAQTQIGSSSGQQEQEVESP